MPLPLSSISPPLQVDVGTTIGPPGPVTEGNDVPIESGLVLPVVVEGNVRVTYTGGGELVLFPSASGHVDGGRLTVVVPVGGATAVRVARTLNPVGAAFDPTKDYQVEIRLNGKFDAECSVHEPFSLVAPTLVGVVAAPGASQMTLQWSAPVLIKSPTSITNGFTAGTARTVTGIVSGNGTSNVILSLSGALDSGSVFDVTVPSAAATSESGVGNAPTVRAVSVDFVFSSIAHRWQPVNRTLNGSDVSAVADSSGSGVAAPLQQGTAANQPAYVASSVNFNSHPSVIHAAGDDEFLTATRTTTDAAAYTVMFVCRLLDSGVGNQALLAAASGAGDPNTGLFLGHDTSSGGRFVWNAGDGTGANQRLHVFALTDPIVVVARVSTNVLDLWVNGVRVSVNGAGTFNPTTIDTLIVGKLTNANLYYGRLEWAEIQVAHAFVADAEIALAQAYAEAKYGI